MQNTLLYEISEGAGDMSEEFMDLRQIMDQRVAPSQYSETGDFIENLFDNGLGTTTDNENETSICQRDEDHNDTYLYLDAVASPLDGDVMYGDPMPMERQSSVMVAQQVLGFHDSNLSNVVLLQGLGHSVDNEQSPEALGPQLGQFSPLDPILFQDVEKESEDNALARMRYHSMNEADYVYESPLPNVARQRSMSENHASAILYQLGSSPNGDSSSNSDIQTTTSEGEGATTTTTVDSFVLDDSFMNGSQDTQTLINNLLFPPPAQKDSTQMTEYSAEVAVVPIVAPDSVADSPSTSGTGRKKYKNIDQRRDKNNAACRESRKRRKDKKHENDRLVRELDVENDELRAKIAKLEVAVKQVKAQVLKTMTASK